MIALTKGEIDIQRYIEAAKTKKTGGIVTFTGVVRDDGIEHIILEAYEEVAEQDLIRIAGEAINKFSLNSVDIIHRIGKMNVGDTILLIVVGAPHRKAAFEGCEYIIDTIKESVPIWKKEYLTTGERWVPGEHAPE
ncbi:MAG TPA: molybdenum cofactor biosynthesis protein MoaE [Methanoregulaceae archaeon]|nr:molybdenum cofactor biosynthesis protein MoaE [Methanoregulaceae archaeon]